MPRQTKIPAAIACGLLLLLAACAGPLYKVAPLPSTPPPEVAGSTTGTGFEVGATALGEELAYDRFSANLPLAGVIAIEVRLINRTPQPIKVDGLRFEIEGAGEAKFKQLKPQKALSRVMKYYGVRLYGKESYRRTREAYEGLALDLGADLMPGEERRGMLYFEAKPPVFDFTGLMLALTGRETRLQLPLS